MQNDFSLLYAEDNQAVREGYIEYFGKFFKKIHEAKDGEEAWEIFKQKRPNIIILDINMPKLSGLEVANKIREIDNESKIIMLTAHSEVEKLLSAIKLNLKEYLIKPVKRNDLDRVINETIQELKTDSNTSVKLKHGFVWDKTTNKLYKRSKEINLTKKEIRLFNLLTSNLDSTFSNEDIMNYLYDFNPNETEFDTSKYRTLLYRLKTKLGVDLIESVYGIGYKLKF